MKSPSQRNTVRTNNQWCCFFMENRIPSIFTKSRIRRLFTKRMKLSRIRRLFSKTPREWYRALWSFQTALCSLQREKWKVTTRSISFCNFLIAISQPSNTNRISFIYDFEILTIGIDKGYFVLAVYSIGMPIPSVHIFVVLQSRLDVVVLLERLLRVPWVLSTVSHDMV